MKSINKSLYTIAIVASIISVFTACASNASSKAKTGVTVELPIVNSDIPLYYAMIDKATKDGAKIDAQYLYDNYISQGSEGLQASYSQIVGAETQEGSIEKYWQWFQPHMKFLETNREVIIGYQDLFTPEDLEGVAESLAEFLDYDFTSTFYFIISTGAIGGTAFEKGIVVDVSMINTDAIDHTDYRFPEFISYHPKLEDVIYLFVHEVMHQLQAIYLAEDGITDDKLNVIGDYILNEGGANFFAELLLQGSHTMRNIERARKYYHNNPQLMEELLAVKDTSVEEVGDDDVKVLNQWFFNGGTVDEGVPPDMGYFLGSVISWDYYDKAEDKKQAFLDIVQHWRGDNKERIFNSFIASRK